MAAPKFVCRNCGATSNVNLGVCVSCGFSEMPDGGKAIVLNDGQNPVQNRAAQKGEVSLLQGEEALPLTKIKPLSNVRISTGLSEFDRVLGGGLVVGSLILLGGDPGAGKTTILTRVSHEMSLHSRILYVSGEESSAQVKLRASRMGIDSYNFYVVYETNLERILSVHVKKVKPTLLIIDSISTIGSSKIAGDMGSPNQVRYCSQEINKMAKTNGVSVFMISHVTKEGEIAGPNKLNHLGDATLYLDGDDTGVFRTLRAVKNRFGDPMQIGIFKMDEDGIHEVPDPSSVFMSERLPNMIGSSVGISVEGNRPLLIEIQGLETPSPTSVGARRATGLSRDRLNLVADTLARRTSHDDLTESNIHVSIVGGISLTESALDLPMALAIISSKLNRPVPDDIISFGEIGLTGQIRTVSQSERRLSEASRLGFRRAIVPSRTRLPKGADVELIKFDRLSEVIDFVFPEVEG